MRVKMVKTVGRRFVAGREYDVARSKGVALCQSGLAVPVVEVAKREQAVVAPPESRQKVE